MSEHIEFENNDVHDEVFNSWCKSVFNALIQAGLYVRDEEGNFVPSHTNKDGIFILGYDKAVKNTVSVLNAYKVQEAIEEKKHSVIQ